MTFRLFKNHTHPLDARWNLITNDQEIIDPSWEDIIKALANAHEGEGLFVTLESLLNEEGIKVLQALGRNEGGMKYRLEAIPCDLKPEIYYCKEDLSFEEALNYYQEFFQTRHIDRFSYWRREEL
ncbi:MAG: hypothetical protein Q4P25_02035 [Tissierellia bacterium]|nr:hypothetical protein [Tissierellia bacterium]